MGKALPEAGEVFTLPPDRERAFFALAEAVGVDPVTASALTLARVVEKGRALAGSHREGFGAASELSWHVRRGAVVEFHCRPRIEVTDHDSAGACAGDAGGSRA